MRWRRYGVPYMGSKNDIAVDIVNCLPPADTFYDLFAGGCAVTHAAIVSGKYKRFVVNDIDWRGITLFKDAIAGKYHNEKRIIDREYFNANKDTDAYVFLCWSFGCRGDAYIYGKEVEELKLKAHRMVMGDTWGERLLLYKDFVRTAMDKLAKVNRPYEIQSLERLQGLERLEGLERWVSLGRLESHIGSYDEVPITGGVIYCDPPYKNTRKYETGAFDHERFYDWLRTRDYPVYVSEYAMPDDFVSIWSKKKMVKLCATQTTNTIERLFVHERWIDKIMKTDLFL